MDSILQDGTAANVAITTSAILWSLAYLLIVRAGMRDGVPGMPFLAMMLNLSWEFVFAFVYPTPEPQIYAIYPWFLLDLLIAAQWLSFGRRAPEPERRAFTIRFVVTLALSLALMVAAVEVFDDTLGRYTAYSQNLLMSILFLRMLRQR